MKSYIDLRSDTVTLQPLEMRKAMFEAEVGDSIYDDDPTTIELEKLAAEITGKEAAIFVLSGTMGNQLSIMSQTRRADQILLGAHAHIIEHECGAPAVLSGVNFRLIFNPDDRIYPADIENYVTPEDVHMPHTTLLCLENALGNGTVVPLDVMKEDYETAHRMGLRVHLDGARLFNAAHALHCDVKDITQYCDSVTFCLSKGLSAPIGSMICGGKEFIARVKRNRKLVGGGLRQSGYLAAAGIYALNHMVDRLQDDHDNAAYLAEKLSALPYLYINNELRDINMVFFRIEKEGFDHDGFVRYLYDHDVKINGQDKGIYRFVTHYGIEKKDIDTVIELMKHYLQ
ncbi:MAG: low-specificity L-threonine aldolase [Erysipelotrichaceae bacterium]|nr:low-specificity L-threonine aldolase [Erysipelotrichaceae bacterium]